MSSKKVLVVEDDAILRKTLVEFLKKENFEVESASDGEEGIEKAKSGDYDAILLDIIIPKKNGYEVVKEMKANDSTKNIPIILLTNLDRVEDIQKALDLGATTYLVKADYKLEEISKKVKEILKM